VRAPNEPFSMKGSRKPADAPAANPLVDGIGAAVERSGATGAGKSWAKG